MLNKPVSLSLKDKTIVESLSQLVKENDVQLAYSEHFFTEQKKVTLKAKSKPMRLVLEQILEGTGVGCKEAGGQIVLFLLEVDEVKFFTLSGFVEDAETGERLIAAAVYSPELGIGTVTNEYGFYSLTLPSTAKNLRFDYIGYSEETVALDKKENQRISRAIKPSLTLMEVVVTPTDTAKGNLLPSPSSMKRFKPEDFKSAPDLGGQSDLFRMMQLLPGVQTSTDGVGGMFVRGGNADQNLVLMDGVPVYNSDHLAGLFSIFNTSAIRDAKLLKGGIPARYGGRISSVMDVYTKDGNQNRWSGEAGVDLLSGKATLEGPFAKKKGTVMVSGRRSHSNFYFLPTFSKILQTDDLNDTNYHFYDFNTKVGYGFSEKDKLYFSFYKGGDYYFGREEFDYGSGLDVTEFELKWGNTITSLRWNHLFGPKMFSNTSMTYSRFNFSFGILVKSSYITGEPGQEPLQFSYFTGLSSQNRDWAWKTDFDYTPAPNHYLRFGASVTAHRFLPNALIDQTSSIDSTLVDSLSVGDYFNQNAVNEINAASMDAYIEDEWRLAKDLTLNTGLRLSGFISDGKQFLLPEPRINLAYQITRRQKMVASLTRTSQYLHRVATSGISFPGDYWTPTNRSLGPQKAWQATLGTEAKLPKGFAFSAEAYYKTMSGLLTFPDSFFYDPIFGEGDPSNYFISSKGKSRGLELLLRREEGRLGGWIGYGLTKTTRVSTFRNIGKPYPFDYDRRHEIKLFTYYRLSNHWNASMNWVYGSPNPQRTDGGSVPSPPGYENSLRSTPYHRLDLALSFTAKTGKLEHQLKLSVFNVYNRKNVAYYILEYDEQNNIKPLPIFLFPATLGIYYGIKF